MPQLIQTLTQKDSLRRALDLFIFTFWNRFHVKTWSFQGGLTQIIRMAGLSLRVEAFLVDRRVFVSVINGINKVIHINRLSILWKKYTR